MIGILILGLVLGTARVPSAVSAETWVGTWAASPQLMAEADLPPTPPGFADTTIRQVVHVSIGGARLRVRFSNGSGTTDLALLSVHVARSAGGSAIRPDTDRALTFGGRVSVTVPAGALIVSDAQAFDLSPLSDLAITIRVRGVPATVTGHPGSRATSFFAGGDEVMSAELRSAVRVEHWYFLNGVDVAADTATAAVAILGDSITDGRGSTTNGNDRWPDVLARRLQARAGPPVAVLNYGLGGNRLLRDGLGPSALARFDRDILATAGVRWLVVLEGINDIGTRAAAIARHEPYATADDIILAYEQIIERAHARDVLVYGATIMPFAGFTYGGYYSADAEADRRRVNDWIRTSGRFDAVIDFDAAMRDPAQPSRLAPAVDGGDHLHPSAGGYRIMADAIDLRLFLRRAGSAK